MNNKNAKKMRRILREEARETYSSVEIQFFTNVLKMPFKKRMLIAWKILRGIKKNV